MTTMAERQAEFAAERRREAGLPVISCPSCGKPEPHWVPESLEEPGGYFTCQPDRLPVAGEPLFTLGGDA